MLPHSKFLQKPRMRTCIFCWLYLCILLYAGSLIRTVTSKSDTEDQTDTGSKHTDNALACSPCSCVYCIIIGTVSGLASGFVFVGGAFIFWKCKKSTIMQCISSAKKNDGQLKTALLQSQAEKTHEELDVSSVLNTLMKELKRGFHQQKEEFKQLEETNKELAENKEKLNLLENEIICEKDRKVKEKKTQLQKQAKKTREELTVLSELITLMLELKRGHRQQKEEFKQLEAINKELAENKKKLRLVENEIAKNEKENETEKTERYLEEKQSLLSVQRKLEKKKEELENLQLNMEKQLLQIEEIMSIMTERKTKVECTLEAINSQLEDCQSQSDTAHLHTQ